MSDSYLDLLKGVIAELKTVTAITDIVGTRIYTDVPQQETFPYITIDINSTDYQTKAESGMEHLLDINVYSRDKSPKEAGDVRAAVVVALDRNEGGITLDTNTITNIYYVSANMFKDPDGVTWHGVVSFRVVII